MIIRRSLTLLLIGICLLLIAGNAAYAEDSYRQLGVGNASGSAGDHLAVPIRLGSDGAVTALQFQLFYSESTLELTELQKGAHLSEAFNVISNIETGKVVIGSLGSHIEEGSREVAVAVFKVKDGAAPGSYDIRLADVQLSDGNARSLTQLFQLVPGSLTVVPSAYTPVDAESPGSQTETNPVVLINGRTTDVGIATTTTVGAKRVITVVLNREKLAKQLASEADGAVIAIPVDAAAGVVIGELDGQLIWDMEQKQAVIKLQTAKAAYSLPAEQVNILALAAQLGVGAQLGNIKIRVEIAELPDDMLQLARDAANREAFTLGVPPVQFSVKAANGDAIVEIAQFNAYIERTIVIPEGTDPGTITTAVVIDPDGTVRHVPTQIVLTEGKYYARISSLTNSVYALVRHPVRFRDMTGHWAKDAVNDMGSRMVIEGTGGGQFSPDLDITRAEFAAIIARGLGLKVENGGSFFSDVRTADWYRGAIHTALAYGLIDGYDDGTFRPNDKITREQAMVIIAKALNLTGLKDKLSTTSTEETLHLFGDAAAIAKWAKSEVADTVQAGIISGRSADTLAPQGYMTRAEVAAAVQRLLEQSGLI